MHWVTGPAGAWKLIDDRCYAEDYPEADARKIEEQLNSQFPSAVVKVTA